MYGAQALVSHDFSQSAHPSFLKDFFIVIDGKVNRCESKCLKKNIFCLKHGICSSQHPQPSGIILQTNPKKITLSNIVCYVQYNIISHLFIL